MSASSTRFIKRCAQWIPKKESSLIPPGTRGVYALLQERPNKRFDVVYIGITSRSSKGRRLARYKNDKGKNWSHFSIFEVTDNLSEGELKELEGLLLEIYRKDPKANRFNKHRKYGKLQEVKEDDLTKWKEKKQR